MPAGGAAATGVHGEDIIDLGVCIKLLKKSIVLLPLLIMLIIFVIRVTLTHHPDSGNRNATQQVQVNCSNSSFSDEALCHQLNLSQEDLSSATGELFPVQEDEKGDNTLIVVDREAKTVSRIEIQQKKDDITSSKDSDVNGGAGLKVSNLVFLMTLVFANFEILLTFLRLLKDVRLKAG